MAAFRWALLAISASAAHALRSSLSLPKVKVNLDLLPKDRWTSIVLPRQQVLRDHIAALKKELEGFNQTWVDQLITELHVPGWAKAEMMGIAAALDDPNITYRDILLRNMRFELGLTHGFGEGTAVLYSMPNGTVLHGRNLDMNGSRADNQQDLIDVTFMKYGQPVFKAVSQLGLVGIDNGLKFGAFSYEGNTMFFPKNAYRGWGDKWVEDRWYEAKHGAKILLFVAREIVLQEDAYTSALARFRGTMLVANMYHILAGKGPYQGAVVTVKPSTKTQARLEYGVKTMSEQNWFMIQTNDEPGAMQNIRGKFGTVYMKWMGRKYAMPSPDKGATSMEKLMRMFPVCGPLTVFTWYMSPATGMDYTVTDACGEDEVPKFPFLQKQGTFLRKVPPGTAQLGEASE